ncbi:peroxisomal membrane protein PMP34-like [Sycon ciliatum]|uniref:peroxisomal membrane protein PMP34-like n=1 Tax=Sycon ciliatum TaxID=27933 RepID=UPI0031F6410F
MSDLLSWSTLVHATAGAAGSVTAMTTFFPLDTARTRLQVNRDTRVSTVTILKQLVEQEGWAALYHGLRPVLISLCVSNFVYFYTFNGLKLVLKRRQIQSSPLKDLLMAAAAGVTNVLMTTPLWVCNMRIRLQGSSATARLPRSPSSPQPAQRPYTGIIDALQRISSEEGVPGLWSGTLPSLLLVSNPAIQFMVYESLKRRIFADKQSVSSMRVFLIGAMAKAIATFVTYPLQLAQSRLRAQQRTSSTGGPQSRSLGGFRTVVHNLVTCLRGVYRESGMAGLYKGIEIKLLQTVSMSALMFVAYEKIAAIIFYLLHTGPNRHPTTATEPLRYLSMLILAAYLTVTLYRASTDT